VTVAAPAADVRTAVVRARWALVQTGLITTGLALFGDYVLSSRVNDVELMPWYVGRFPMGAAIVGAAAALGYFVGSWWTGVRVRGWLLVGILGLQLLAYIGAHYAEFATHPLYWRDTEEPVRFWSYFHYTTMELAFTGAQPPTAVQAYALRGVEFLVFAALALLSPFVLIWRERCTTCGASAESLPIGSLAHVDDVRTLKQMSAANNLAIMQKLISPTPGTIDLMLLRCPVCGTSTLVAPQADAVIPVSPQLADELLDSHPAHQDRH
jgi:hypothetical protein